MPFVVAREGAVQVLGELLASGDVLSVTPVVEM